MTIVPNRLGVKFNLKREPALAAADIVPIFQRWIQEHRVEGMLIDVIDYKHVPEGPGVILIADEGDYAYDFGDGQIGLHYIRKRNLPGDMASALLLAFRLALGAALCLEDEAPGDIEFDFSSAKISFLDRQRYRNDHSLYMALQDELSAILADIYGCDVALERAYDDPRLSFALRVTAQRDSVDGHKLLARLLERPVSA
ncbi:MAG: hypothetical protein OXT68_07345 [Chloroflexota bacterium]|nr:hypothetical protein [Chloroflexota bacterium]